MAQLTAELWLVRTVKGMDGPEFYYDPLASRLAFHTPGRSSRPMAADGLLGASGDCVFCPTGHLRTEVPQLARAVRRSGEATVVENQFPLVAGDRGRHELVIIGGSEHPRRLTDLSGDCLYATAQVIEERVGANSGRWADCAIWINVGFAAGATQDHLHAQMAWFAQPIPQLTIENEACRSSSGCVVCQEVHGTLDADLRFFVGDSVAGWAARAPGRNGELVAAPLRHTPTPRAQDLAAAMAVLAHGGAACGFGDHNLTLHLREWGSGFHWHMRLHPRVPVDSAGLEVGFEVRSLRTRPETVAAKARTGIGAQDYI